MDMPILCMAAAHGDKLDDLAIGENLASILLFTAQDFLLAVAVLLLSAAFSCAF